MPYPFRCNPLAGSECFAVLSNGNTVRYSGCQCSLKDEYDSYCPFPGPVAYKSQFILYAEAATSSPQCHPDVIERRIFHEWESCTFDVNKVQDYKKAYQLSKYWPIIQRTYNNSKQDASDQEAVACFEEISPIRFDQKGIYNDVEKLKRSTYTSHTNLLVQVFGVDWSHASNLKLSAIAFLSIFSFNCI